MFGNSVDEAKAAQAARPSFKPALDHPLPLYMGGGGVCYRYPVGQQHGLPVKTPS